MAVRAQQAAVSGEIMSPPPFPRTIWVLIVSKCALRERDVVLPMTCRFFRNLSPPAERLANIKNACGFKLAIDVPPSYLFFLSQGPNVKYPQRLEAFARDYAYVIAHRVVQKFLFRATIETAPLSRYWFAARPPSELENKGEQSDVDFISLKLDDVEIRMEIRALRETPGRFALKLSVCNSTTRVVFRVKAAILSERFGFNAGGTQALERISAGCGAVATMLGLEPHLLDAPRFIKMLAVLLQPCADLPNGAQQYGGGFMRYLSAALAVQPADGFFEKFLLGESNEIKVKIGSALELSQSQELLEDSSSGETLGFALKALSWPPTEVAAFFSSHGLPECETPIIDNKITGRALVEGRCSSSDFVPKQLSTKETFATIDRVDALRKKYFGK